MTKHTSNPHDFGRNYSSIYSVLVLILLISFVPKSVLPLSALSSNFRWRGDLIDLYIRFRFMIGDQVFNKAVIGKEGWIFYTGESSIQDYQNTQPMKKKTLIFLQKELSKLDAELEQQGIKLLVVIPPNKSTVYPQYMPDQIPVLRPQSRLDQFVEFMNLHGGVDFVDLRRALLDPGQSQMVYYKTDTHWNDLGAYYGYAEIMNALYDSYPALKPHALSDFEYTNMGSVRRDLPLLMGFSDYPEESWSLVPRFKVDLKETSLPLSNGRSIRTVTNSEKDLPKLLVFHDSFYNGLSPFIEPHFREVKTIPFTTDPHNWSLRWIEREKPDIVIIEVVERYLDGSLSSLLENSN